MIKVDVKNKQNTVGWSALFATQPEVDAWIAEQISLGSWGKPDRWVQDGVEDVSGATETRQTLEGVTEYHLPVEYTIEQSDVTAEVQHQTDVLTRTQVREGCGLVIDFIADYNKKNLNSAGMQALASQAWFVSASVFLLTGAPAMAQGLIALHGAEVYPQAVVDEVVALLEPLK